MATCRARWRSRTMLCVSIGAAFLSVWSAQAADMWTKAPPSTAESWLAVDGLNAKYDAFGGQLNHKSFWGGRGSWSAPLANSFGVQVDAAGGKFDSRPYQV